MVGDDESGFAFIQNLFASFTCDSGDIGPSADAVQRVGVYRQITLCQQFIDPLGVVERWNGGQVTAKAMGALPEVSVMEQQPGSETEDQTQGEPGFNR